MPLRMLTLVLLAAGLAFLSPRSLAADANQVQSDSELLRSAGLGVDGPALIEYFKKRIVNDADRDRIAKLIRELGSDDFDTREKASVDLTTLGAPASAQLKQAVKNPDVEVSRRAAQCLQQIDKVASAQYLCAAARLLAHRKPVDAVETLLAFVPQAEDQIVVETVIDALKNIGFKDGKPKPALVQALMDKNAARRAVAGEVLCLGGTIEDRKLAQKLLEDADVQVRLSVALALFDTGEKDSVPVLIALLLEAPRDKAWSAESALLAIAGNKAPQGSLSGDDAARKKYHKAWAAWWQDNGKNIDLAKMDRKQRQLGFTLVCQLDATGATGRVMELDQAGKVRWQIDKLRYPIDAQLLPGDKVLIAEYTGRVVTERNLKGEVLWSKVLTTSVLSARRLRNGNTFIASRSQLLEVDKDGKAVATINRNDIAGAVKLRDGDIGLITTTGKFIHMDETGKERKSFNVGRTITTGVHFEVLPNGHVLVPLYTAGKVVEYDQDGKETWSANCKLPTCVSRLPNGNTLVGGLQAPFQTVEMDRNGKLVTHINMEGRPLKVERR